MIYSFRLFRDIVNTQSFTKAAHLNYVTQSAASHHLKALEDKFGSQLIERGGNQIRLTRTGALVLEAAKDILKRYEELEGSLKTPTTEVSGRLHVGCTYTIGLYELPQLTTSFLTLYPKVDLMLAYLKDTKVYEAVLGEHTEVGIVDSPKVDPRLTITPFKKEPLVLIASANHPWASKKRVRLAQLHGEPFIVQQAEFPVDDIFRKTKIRVKVVHAFENIEITKRAVEIGLGLAIVPRVAIIDEVKSGKLKAIEFSEGPFERRIAIITRKRAALSLPARKFIDLLTAP